MDVAIEPVAPARQRLHVGPALRIVAERIPEDVEITVEVGFLNHHVLPDRVQQLGLADDPAVVGHQHQEDLDGLGRKRDVPAIAR